MIPPTDFWEQACGGDVAAAYRGLEARLERAPRDEALFLQLYWLAVVAPEVAPDLDPTTWLVRGLRACGLYAGRLRELLRRAAERYPGAATAAAWDDLLDSGTPVPLVEFAAEWRWRAARLVEAEAVIVADVDRLRRWLPAADPAAYARLLLLAADGLAWIAGADRKIREGYRSEAEQVAHDHALDLDDELTRYEYADAVTTGLHQRGWAGIDDDGLADLLRHAWSYQGADFPARRRTFGAWLAVDPEAALTRLDAVHRVSPAVLGLLWQVLDGDGGDWPDPPTAFAAAGFLATTRWGDYPSFRPKLLRFCLRERVAPATFARVVDDLPGYVLPGHLPLGLVIGSDWPLLATYRACAVAWE